MATGVEAVKRRNWWIGGAIAAVVVLGWTGFGVYVWKANDLPPPEVDTRRLPDPNGWDALVRALDQTAPLAEDSPLKNLSKADPGRVQEALVQREPELRRIRTAFRLPSAGPFVVDSQALERTADRARAAARIFAAKAHVLGNGGQPRAAVDNALDALELGAVIGNDGGFLGYLIQAACTSIGTQQAEACPPYLSAAEAHQAGTRLDRILARSGPYSEALRGEERMVLHELREYFDGRPIPGEQALEEDKVRILKLYPKSFEYGDIQRCFAELIRTAGKPYPHRRVLPEPRFLYSRTVLPVYSDAALVSAKHETTIRLLRLQFALAEYRGEHGNCPASLASMSLPPGASTEDPFTGQPLRYRRSGSHYLLYSLGPDGKDDDGTPASASKLKAGTHGDLVAGHLFSAPRPSAEEAP